MANTDSLEHHFQYMTHRNYYHNYFQKLVLLRQLLASDNGLSLLVIPTNITASQNGIPGNENRVLIADVLDFSTGKNTESRAHHIIVTCLVNGRIG